MEKIFLFKNTFLWSVIGCALGASIYFLGVGTNVWITAFTVAGYFGFFIGFIGGVIRIGRKKSK